MKRTRRILSWIVLWSVFWSAYSWAAGHALLVGVETYDQRERIRPFEGAAADARGVASALREIGFAPKNVRVLVSDGQPLRDGEGKATYKSIHAELMDLARRAKPEDTVIVFFCGHGTPFLPDSGIWPQDMNPLDAGPVEKRPRRPTYLDSPILMNALAAVHAQTIVAAFDLWRDHPLLDQTEAHNTLTPLQVQQLSQVKPTWPPKPTNVTPQLPSNFLAFFSCSPDPNTDEMRSYAWPGAGRGNFGYFLEEALRRAADQQGILRVGQVVDFVTLGVSSLLNHNPLAIAQGEVLGTVLATNRPPAVAGQFSQLVPTGAKPPTPVELLIRRSRAMEFGGDPEGARKPLEEALRLAPQSAQALGSMGRWEMMNGDAAKAESLLRRAIQADPSRPGLVKLLATLLTYFKPTPDPKEALQLVRRATELDPRSAISFYSLSIRLSEQDTLDEAEAAARRAVALAPYFSQALVQLAWLIGARDKVASDAQSEALRLQQRAFAMSPGDRAVAINYARLLIRFATLANNAKGMARAENILRPLLKADPQDAEAVNEMGFVHRRRNDTVSEERAWREAIRLAPEWAVPVMNLATLFHYTKMQPVEAERLYRKAMKLAPHWAAPVRELAALFRSMHQDKTDAGRLDDQAARLEHLFPQHDPKP